MPCSLSRTSYCCCLSVAALLLITPASDAQEPTAQSPTPSIPRRFVKDSVDLWRTPFRRDTYRDRTLTKYILPFAAITAGLVIADRKIAEGLPNTTAQQRWSGRVSQAGASYTTAGFAAATFLTGQLTGNDRVRETGLLSLEALAHSQLLVFAVKQLTNRQRPVNNNGEGNFWKGGNSFPSGHATAAFAVASVFAHQYGENKVVPVVAYTAAALVATSRPGARRHWASDIVVGSTTGYLLGRFVYKRHHNPRLDLGRDRKPSKRIPQVGFSGGGFVLGWQW